MCTVFSYNGSIKGYSVPEVMCSWFGSLSHPLPLPSPTPNRRHVIDVVLVVLVVIVIVVINGSYRYTDYC
jgi:hypothetical protein